MKKICDKKGTNVKYTFLLEIAYSKATYLSKRVCDMTLHLVFLGIASLPE